MRHEADNTAGTIVLARAKESVVSFFATLATSVTSHCYSSPVDSSTEVAATVRMNAQGETACGSCIDGVCHGYTGRGVPLLIR